MGYAELVDKQGKAISRLGPAHRRHRVLARRTPSSPAGRRSGPDEVVIDDVTAGQGRLRARRPDQDPLPGPGRGSSPSPACARSTTCSAPPRPASTWRRPSELLGEAGSARRHPGRRPSPASRPRCCGPASAPSCPSSTRSSPTTRRPGRRPGVVDQGPRLPHHRPADVRRRRPARRRLHHLQHVLDPGGPADPGARPAAGARRQPAPAHRVGAGRGRWWSASWPRPSASCLGLGRGPRACWPSCGLIGFELPVGADRVPGPHRRLGWSAGVVVTVAAAIIPARRATKVSPMAAIVGRAADDRSPSDAGWASGARVALVGLASLFIGLFGRSTTRWWPSASGRPVSWSASPCSCPSSPAPAAWLLGLPLVRIFGQPAVLGRENAMRNPRRTAATAAALMIGITPGRAWSPSWPRRSRARPARPSRTRLRADFVVTPRTAAGAQGGVPTAVADRLRKSKSVALVSEIRGGQWGLDGPDQDAGGRRPEDRHRSVRARPGRHRRARGRRRLDDKGVLVRDSVAERHGWKVGDEVPMTFARTGRAAHACWPTRSPRPRCAATTSSPSAPTRPTTSSSSASRSTCG